MNTRYQQASYSTRTTWNRAEHVYYYLMLIKIGSEHQLSQFLARESNFLSKLGFEVPLTLMSKAQCFL